MLFFSTHNKSCSGCTFSGHLLPLSASPKSCGGENKSPPENQFNAENIFYSCHLGKKLIMEFGFPEYQWGTLVHSVSQVFASIHLLQRCHLSVIKKGTKGVDICILSLFLSNYVNGKTPREITCPHPWYSSSSERQYRPRFFNDSDCHVALCSPFDFCLCLCVFYREFVFVANILQCLSFSN